MIQKSRPALLQPQDVGDRVETLMVNCGEWRQGLAAPGPLVRGGGGGGDILKVAKGQRPSGTLFRSPDARRTGWGRGAGGMD